MKKSNKVKKSPRVLVIFDNELFVCKDKRVIKILRNIIKSNKI